jgi:hypothetical protein
MRLEVTPSFSHSLASYTRALKRVTGEELGQNPKETKARLSELVEQAQKTLTLVEAALKG